LPSFVVISKLIPEGVESSIVGIFKSLQAFSIVFYGRILGTLVGHLINVQQMVTNKPNAVIFFGMIVVAASGAVVFFFTYMLPKDEEIEETQQAIFY